MTLEYEYLFKNYNKKQIISEIKKLGAKKFGHFIFRVITFSHPHEENNTYIRIRDEGYKCTMTTKTKTNKSQFSVENEVIIDNFNEAEKILYSLGCKKKYYYEKMREIWKLNDTEIVFDISPGVNEIMEIEAKSKKILDSLVQKLNLEDSIVDKSIKMDKYEELYGFTVSKDIIELTFNNARKELYKYVKKNKSLFNKLIKIQKELYNSLLK
jgi:predicted adenylyl cyclase CyaB